MYNDYYVYALFRGTGVPFYIGLGRNGRIDHHLQRYKEQDTHRNRIIRGMMETIGDVPRVKIQEGLTKAQAVETEIALIAAIGREPTGPLVNQTSGGDGVKDISPEARARGAARTSVSLMGRKRPQEVIDRITATHRARAAEYYRLNPKPPKPPKTPNGGRIWTEEQRRAISEKRKGFKHTDEARAKMSEKLRGGKLSKEHKAKISEFHRARVRDPESEARRIEIAKAGIAKMTPEAKAERSRKLWETRRANEIAARYKRGEEYRNGLAGAKSDE